MNTKLKNEIINSYANVLSNIINNHKNGRELYNDLKEKLLINDFSLNDIKVNPFNIKQYKDIISNIIKQIESDSSEIKKFFIMILQRKYCYLLQDIIIATKAKIKKDFKKKEIKIISSTELLEKNKKFIIEEIYKKEKNVDINFIIDNKLKDTDIEIIYNDKICELNIKNLIENFFRL